MTLPEDTGTPPRVRLPLPVWGREVTMTPERLPLSASKSVLEKHTAVPAGALLEKACSAGSPLRLLEEKRALAGEKAASVMDIARQPAVHNRAFLYGCIKNTASLENNWEKRRVRNGRRLYR